MKIEYEPNYGSDRDGNRGLSTWNIELDNSLEERQEIAEKIYDVLMADGWVNLERFNVTLSIVKYSNCTYSEQYDETLYDETLYDETKVEFDTDISPIDYMDLIIPLAIEQIDDSWDTEDVAHLLYLETALIEAGYKGKELVQLTNTVKHFKENLKNEN